MTNTVQMATKNQQDTDIPHLLPPPHNPHQNLNEASVCRFQLLALTSLLSLVHQRVALEQ